MDLTSLIIQQLAAQQAAMPRPDKPPANIRRATPQPKPPGYATRLVNGKWVLVPINGGNKDPALVPRITVTPIRRTVV